MASRSEARAVVQPDPRTHRLLAPAPARKVIFGPVPSTDATRAIVRRLRAAIGLGLLTSGERLPRESDLASQLGVTTFSLREALGELRRQDLIVTRPGKYGGSFVASPETPEALGHDDLLELSSADLRDMGDWRTMLVTAAAGLAAERGTEHSFDLLADYVEQVRGAETSQQARRAHGRFHVELASAAQSMRMTRAEFAVHEEVDWLFGIALTSAQQREATARGLSLIAEAVRSRDAAMARTAAEHHSRYLIAELVRLRLGLIAAAQPGETSLVISTLQDEVSAYCAGVVAVLEAIGERAAPELAARAPEPRLRQEVAVAILQQAATLPSSIRGLGVLAEVGAVPAAPYWTEWWDITPTGPAHSTRHVMDPTDEHFYDYGDKEFIAYPRRSLTAWACGPYVDFLGADDYIVSFSAPLLHDNRFLGVAVADVHVADLERHMAPWLIATDKVMTVVNHESRVILSNALVHGAGEVVRDPATFASVSLPLFGWRVLTKREPAPPV